jgi:hypothetical protein
MELRSVNFIMIRFNISLNRKNILYGYSNRLGYIENKDGRKECQKGKKQKFTI